MASLLAIGGKALVNALAFSGTNAAFSMLGDHGRAEAKRYNLAMEKVTRARRSQQRDCRVSQHSPALVRGRRRRAVEGIG